jgi:hypothetical protein
LTTAGICLPMQLRGLRKDTQHLGSRHGRVLGRYMAGSPLPGFRIGRLLHCIALVY